MTLAAILIAVHALAGAVWVGGMFFAYLALRPAVDELSPPVKLPLLVRVFRRFFPWVWLALLLLLVSGYGLILGVFDGFAAVGLHVHLMQGLGLLMMLLFLHLYFAPFRRLKAAVAGQDWSRAATDLAQVRTLIQINLVLGLIVIAVASSGRFW